MSHAHGLAETCQDAASIHDAVGSAASRSRPRSATLAAMIEGLWDGIAAQRRYEHQRSTGVSHAIAIRKAFHDQHN